MRARINEDVKLAMKSGDKARLSTLRLVNAAIKDRDLAAGVDEKGRPTGRDKITDQEIQSLLQKMVKQRRESFEIYDKAGRRDLADQEAAEIAVIEGYLPKQMGEAETKAAIEALVAELGAAGLKDMGRVMGAAKERYAGAMDFAKAGAIVKDLLKSKG
ncbi:MAG TPA: GatB/YqeY domain-containing protein [Hyphomicrobiaceae bacterium]|nr:GatB/YqeY domain-containing protein [Hyphomicrobiaceae bacterium]